MTDPSSTSTVLRSAASTYHRRLPIGAEPIDRERTHVRVWAPARQRVQVVVNPANAARDGAALTALDAEGGGYFSGVVPAVLGDRYAFRLDDEEKLYPDPASRFQPEGVHGPSEILDPHTFRWTDQAWTGVNVPTCIS